MKTGFAVIAWVLLAGAAGAQPIHPATEVATCTPSMGLNFICGLPQPEDILQIGASKYLLASGMEKGGGVSLIDSEAKTARRLYTGQSRPDRKLYPDCPTPPQSVRSTAEPRSVFAASQRADFRLVPFPAMLISEKPHRKQNPQR